MSIHEKIYNSLQKLFQDEVIDDPSGSFNFPVQWDNTKDVERSKTVSYRFSILPGEVEQADMGASTRRFRHRGIVAVQVFAPFDGGMSEISQVVDHVSSVFRSRIYRPADLSIVLQSPSSDTIGKDGQLWGMAIFCPFWADSSS